MTAICGNPCGGVNRVRRRDREGERGEMERKRMEKGREKEAEKDIY